MNNNFHEEKVIEKSFDLELFKRLFKFTKPYMPVFLLCIVLLFFITAVDLIRPYLIKVVIDDYINIWEEPMVTMDEPLVGLDSSFYENQYYVREKTLINFIDKHYHDTLMPASTLGLNNKIDRLIHQDVSWASGVDSTKRYQLYIHKDGQYLIEGLLPDGIKVNESQLGQGLLKSGDESFNIRLLSDKEYQAFRVKDIEGIFNVIIIFTLVLFGGFILNYIQALLLNYAAQRQIYHMRQALFDHLMHQSLTFF